MKRKSNKMVMVDNTDSKRFFHMPKHKHKLNLVYLILYRIKLIIIMREEKEMMNNKED
jgi:hypothetical protein